MADEVRGQQYAVALTDIPLDPVVWAFPDTRVLLLARCASEGMFVRLALSPITQQDEMILYRLTNELLKTHPSLDTLAERPTTEVGKKMRARYCEIIETELWPNGALTGWPILEEADEDTLYFDETCVVRSVSLVKLPHQLVSYVDEPTLSALQQNRQVIAAFPVEPPTPQPAATTAPAPQPGSTSRGSSEPEPTK